MLSHGNTVIGVPGPPVSTVNAIQIEMVRNAANGQARLTGGSANGSAALDSQQQKNNEAMMANYRSNMGMSGRGLTGGVTSANGAAQAQAATSSLLEGQQFLSSYKTTTAPNPSQTNRQGKIHSSQQPSHGIQVITPQIYSQQRQRGVAQTNSTQANNGVLHNTQHIAS